jgi:hypothetical protein
VLKEVKLIETEIVALEPTIVLTIDNELYKSILMKSVEKELDAKMR